MQPPTVLVALVMQHARLENRSQSANRRAVAAVAVASHPGTPPSIIDQDHGGGKWLHAGPALSLYRDEAEGYFLDLTMPQFFVFAMWRVGGEGALARAVTAIYHQTRGVDIVKNGKIKSSNSALVAYLHK